MTSCLTSKLSPGQRVHTSGRRHNLPSPRRPRSPGGLNGMVGRGRCRCGATETSLLGSGRYRPREPCPLLTSTDVSSQSRTSSCRCCYVLCRCVDTGDWCAGGVWATSSDSMLRYHACWGTFWFVACSHSPWVCRICDSSEVDR